MLLKAISMDLLFASKYPFSKEAREFVSSRNVRLSYDAIERAKNRLTNALKNGSIPPLELGLSGSLENEIVSYAVSRMIISLVKSQFFISRYAIAEAKRASHYLREERSDENLMKIVKELKIEAKFDGDYSIRFTDYLKYSPKSIDYKLVNKKISNGNVYLKRNEFIRVVEEAIKMMIYSQLPLKIDSAPEEIKKAADEIRKQLPKEESLFIVPVKGEENYPPCIRKIIADLRASLNVPHTGRWALAVYLISIGVKTDEIVSLFATAPDYDDKVTRYQVEYAKKRSYKMPSCLSMDSYGLRVSDCPCINDRRIKTPLQFRRGASVGRKA